jgi:DNA-binding transcriptional LysR family regulator
MNLDYIREFCALADVKKYSEAAEISYISQSALSKHIKSLETELGAPLFHRTAHFVILTEFGEAFLPYAKELGDIQLKCQNNLLSKINNENKDLTIGISPLVSISHLFQNLPDQALQKADFSLRFREAHNQHLRKLLTTGQCDLIITTDKQSDDEDNFIVSDYCTDPFCLVCKKEINITRTNVESVPYVQIGSESFYGMIFRRIRRPDFVAPNFLVACELVEQASGFTICTQSQATQLVSSALKMQPSPLDVSLHYYLMYNLPSLMSPNTTHLIEFLKMSSPKL